MPLQAINGTAPRRWAQVAHSSSKDKDKENPTARATKKIFFDSSENDSSETTVTTTTRVAETELAKSKNKPDQVTAERDAARMEVDVICPERDVIRSERDAIRSECEARTEAIALTEIAVVFEYGIIRNNRMSPSGPCCRILQPFLLWQQLRHSTEARGRAQRRERGR